MSLPVCNHLTSRVIVSANDRTHRRQARKSIGHEGVDKRQKHPVCCDSFLLATGMGMIEWRTDPRYCRRTMTNRGSSASKIWDSLGAEGEKLDSCAVQGGDVSGESILEGRRIPDSSNHVGGTL